MQKGVVDGSAGKRKRVVLTIETKFKIIERLLEGESVRKLASEFNIGTQTVRDIFRKKDKLLNFVCSTDTFYATKSRKTIKASKFEALDSAVYEWFKQKRAQGQPFNGQLLLEKAAIFHKQLKIEEPFVASQGWLQRFKSRHGIDQPHVRRQPLDGDPYAADLYRTEFAHYVTCLNLSPEQIYNAGETGLYWNALPSSKALVSQGDDKSGPGPKPCKERITLMACSNASGTHKLKLVCVGKPKLPRSFNDTEMHLPVVYYDHSKAWMDQDIFRQWFFDEFVPAARQHMRSKGLPERAMLLLDNSPSHPNQHLLNTSDGQVFAAYLPPNVTSLLQPMDQGVLEALKHRYRKTLLGLLVGGDSDIDQCFDKWLIKDAIFASAKSWDDIPAQTLQRSWRKLIPGVTIDDDDNEDNEASVDDNPVNTSSFLQILLRSNGFEGIKEEHVQNWLDSEQSRSRNNAKEEVTVSAEASASAEVTEEDSVEMTEEVDDKQDQDEDQDEDQDDMSDTSDVVKPVGLGVNTISLQEALNCTETLLTFLEQQEDTSVSDMVNIRNLRTFIKMKMCTDSQSSDTQ